MFFTHWLRIGIGNAKIEAYPGMLAIVPMCASLFPFYPFFLVTGTQCVFVECMEKLSHWLTVAYYIAPMGLTNSTWSKHAVRIWARGYASWLKILRYVIKVIKIYLFFKFNEIEIKIFINVKCQNGQYILIYIIYYFLK